MARRFSRDDWLRADDATLLAGCEVDTYRASGPGGQKRNKTSSAVRLRHTSTGLLVIAEESRSQHENKARALRRLRLAIALSIRENIASPDALANVFQPYRTAAGRIEISPRNGGYPLVIAFVMDIVQAHLGRLADAASALNVTTAQLSRFLTNDAKLLAAVNQIRIAAGQKPIAAPRP